LDEDSNFSDSCDGESDNWDQTFITNDLIFSPNSIAFIHIKHVLIKVLIILKIKITRS
jgi:hypothetical protein